MLAMVLVLGLQQYCGQGPLWESLQPSDKVYCEKYWWTNLLYVNNLVHLDEPVSKENEASYKIKFSLAFFIHFQKVGRTSMCSSLIFDNVAYQEII